MRSTLEFSFVPDLAQADVKSASLLPEPALCPTTAMLPSVSLTWPTLS